jgi:hypothetical protein
MDRIIDEMLRVEEKKGGTEWCKPCILESIDRI